MKQGALERYDLEKLLAAKKLLIEVREYYYGAPGYSRLTNRVQTIIRKIEAQENRTN